MQKLDPMTYRTMPWKNGGGVTTEALVVPEGASLDTFELRVSMARVEADGPFSELPGVDRTLLVIEGQGLTLAMADDARVTLDTSSEPLAFTGDDPVHATLAAGPIVDFNLMTRRSRLSHTATRLTLEAPRSLAVEGELGVVLVLSGGVVLARDGAALSLARGDLATLDAGGALVATRPPGQTGATTLLFVDVARR
jgi:environmental stress-induced protein Ves